MGDAVVAVWCGLAGFTAGAVAYYRNELPARHLPGRAVTIPPERPSLDGMEDADTLIWTGIGNHITLWLQEAARQRGQRVLIEADDNYLSGNSMLIAEDPGELSFSEQVRRGFDGTLFKDDLIDGLCETYKQQLHHADGVIVSTPALAAALEKWNPRTFVCANTVDPDDWPTSADPEEGRPFTVGFAGSHGHRDDVALIRDALAWAAEQPGVAVAMFGIDPSNDEMTWEELRQAKGLLARAHAFAASRPQVRITAAGLYAPPAPRQTGNLIKRGLAKFEQRVKTRRSAWQFPFRRIGWQQDFHAYARELARLDVGLCPIVDNDFSRCRSDSKVLEYAMAGVLPIVSDVAPYEPWKDTPVLFAQTAEEFRERVEWAIAHPGEVRERAAAVREIVLADRAMPAAVEPWREAINLDAGGDIALPENLNG